MKKSWKWLLFMVFSLCVIMPLNLYAEEKKAPSIVRYVVNPIYQEQSFEVLAYTDGEIDELQVPVWTQNNQQDDIQWYAAKKGLWKRGNQIYNWRCVVPFSMHNEERGMYELHFYAYQKGKVVSFKNTTYEIGQCKIGNRYYLDLSEALQYVKSGETIYILQNHALLGSFDNTQKQGNTFTNVKILPFGEDKKITISGTQKLAFWQCGITFGSTNTGKITFDLSNVVIEESNTDYCGVICVNRDSYVRFENCVFENGTQIKRWIIHGEHGQVDMNNSTIKNCLYGIGVITNSTVPRSAEALPLKVTSSMFENITEAPAVHYSIYEKAIHAEIVGNTFRNCKAGIDGVRHEAGGYRGSVQATVKNNSFIQCYIGETFKQDTTNKANTFKVYAYNEQYDGYTCTHYASFVKDTISAGFFNRNVDATIEQSGYRNGIHGIINIENGSTYVKQGKISGNQAGNIISDLYGQKNKGGGIFIDSGSVVLENTDISQNTADCGGGIYQKSGILEIKNGRILENTARQGSGVFVGQTFRMKQNAWIHSANDVYLSKNCYIEIPEALTQSLAARVTPSEYTNGRKIAQVTYGEKGSKEFGKLYLTPKDAFCIRPGDYQSTAAKTKDTDIVISTKYEICYHKNTNGEVSNLPTNGTKYWYEKAIIAEGIPKWGNIIFKGWSEDKSSSKATYQPKSIIADSINRKIDLFAIWDEQLQIVYAGNGEEKGNEKIEVITYRDIVSSGYTIRKNKGYTNFEKKQHTFVGWSTRADSTTDTMEFEDSKNNIVSFETLYKASIPNESTSSPRKVILYAVWDQAPVIHTVEKEYYEGQIVTGADLLQDVTAVDREDKDVTEKLKIIQIQYADGKLEGETKQEGETKTWADGMSKEDTLDTWFLQLDKKDSPVIHKITYEVEDRVGNVTQAIADVKIKYNEFPLISAEERYFTLEEATQGKITEDALLKDAAATGKLQATDTEDGNLTQEIQILDFYPEEFQAFTNSGYVVLNFKVQDHMGPDGKGKETIQPVTIHIIKDGEVVENLHETYVRFINEKYYRLNVGVDFNQLSKSNQEEIVKNGGLHPDSKWYQDEECSSIILSTWQEDKRADEVWKFSAKDVKAVKEYIDTYGLGNIKDKSAIRKFRETFANLLSTNQ